MKLKDVEVFIVAPPPPGWGGRYWIFAKLTTACGIVGYGEIISFGLLSVVLIFILLCAYNTFFLI